MAEVEITLSQGGLNQDGTFMPSTEFYYKTTVMTQYIDVKGYKTIDISIDYEYVEIGYVAYYNSNKTFIKYERFIDQGLRKLRLNIDDPNVAFVIFDMSDVDDMDCTPDLVTVSTNLSGKRATLEVGPCGYNYDGTLDANTAFTHLATYIPVAGNENATVTWGGIEGWLRYTFYNKDKAYIGQYTGTTAQTSQSIANLIATAPSAIYIRMSINKTVPGYYGLYIEGSEYDEVGPPLGDSDESGSIRNIKIGSLTIDKIYLGTDNISKVYLGDTLIFGGAGDAPQEPDVEEGYEEREGYPVIIEDENIDMDKEAYLVELSGENVSVAKVTDGYVISIISTDIAYEFGKGGRVD